MDIHWLLEKYMFEDERDGIIKSIIDNGMFYKEVDNTYDKDFSFLYNDSECVISRGSIQFIKKINRTCPWYPGSYASFENFRCSSYYHYFDQYLLNRDFYILPFGYLALRKDKIFLHSDEMFFRPDSGSKSFTGKIVHKDELESFINTEVTCYSVMPEEMVLISDKVEISKEFRFIVVGDRIISGSQYMINGERDESVEVEPEALVFLQTILNNVTYRPDKIFSADIGMTPTGPRLIELNSFSSCGLYKSDPDKVVKAVKQVVIEDYNDVFI